MQSGTAQQDIVDKTINTNEVTIVDAFIMVAPYLNRLLHDDVLFSIYDTEKLLFRAPAKTFSLDSKIGDPLIEGDIMTDTIRDNKDYAAVVPAEILGVPIASRTIPLHDEEGNVIGAVGTGTSTERYHQLFNISSTLSQEIEQATATLSSMTHSITELADNINRVTEQALQANDSLTDIDTVATTVGNIADQSDLLGLNAAIEAARAGKEGRGFAIVADEVRKLAITSKDYATDINETTEKVRELIEQLHQSIAQVNEQSERQSIAIQGIAETMRNINENVQQLAEMAEAIVSSE